MDTPSVPPDLAAPPSRSPVRPGSAVAARPRPVERVGPTGPAGLAAPAIVAPRAGRWAAQVAGLAAAVLVAVGAVALLGSSDDDRSSSIETAEAPSAEAERAPLDAGGVQQSAPQAARQATEELASARADAARRRRLAGRPDRRRPPHPPRRRFPCWARSPRSTSWPPDWMPLPRHRRPPRQHRPRRRLGAARPRPPHPGRGDRSHRAARAPGLRALLRAAPSWAAPRWRGGRCWWPGSPTPMAGSAWSGSTPPTVPPCSIARRSPPGS